MEIPLNDIIIVGSFLVTWALVQLYKKLLPGKPINPLLINGAVSAAITAVVYELSAGDTDAVKIAKAALTALISFIGSMTLHANFSGQAAAKQAAALLAKSDAEE